MKTKPKKQKLVFEGETEFVASQIYCWSGVDSDLWEATEIGDSLQFFEQIVQDCDYADIQEDTDEGDAPWLYSGGTARVEVEYPARLKKEIHRQVKSCLPDKFKKGRWYRIASNSVDFITSVFLDFTDADDLWAETKASGKGINFLRLIVNECPNAHVVWINDGENWDDDSIKRPVAIWGRSERNVRADIRRGIRQLRLRELGDG